MFPAKIKVSSIFKRDSGMVPLCTAFCNDPYSVELVGGGHSAIPRG